MIYIDWVRLMSSSLKFLIILSLFVFSQGNVLAFADSTNQTALLLEQGEESLQLGKFEEAISYYDDALKIEKDNVEALAKKGDALAKLGKSEEAASYYKKVIDISPYYADSLGVLYLDKLLQIEPDNLYALYKRGMSLSFFADHLDKAISYFDRALEIVPNRHDILTSKGFALFNLNKTEEAISYYDKALEIKPNYIPALNGKGEALTALGKFEEAFSYLNQVLSLEPDNIDALLRKADAFRAQGNFHEAFSYFYKVLEFDPDNFIALNKIKIVHANIGFVDFDGFIETKITDSKGNLVSHLKINVVKIFDHEIAQQFINNWNFTKKITRDGIDYEVLQHERIRDEPIRTYHGGASHYGIYALPDFRELALISADYWFFEVDKGDTSTIVITAFRPTN